MTAMKPSDTFPLDQEGIWTQIIRKMPEKLKTPALFLDRDGVIIEEVSYIQKAEDVVLIPGATEMILQANRANIPVIIITNQSGIARGYSGWTEFVLVQEKMLKDLQTGGAYVNAVYACPYHGDGKKPYNHPNHSARKPNPGMLLRAFDSFSIDRKRSWIIGDKAQDMEAGVKAGLGGGVHVLTGHGKDEGERQQALSLRRRDFTILPARSIMEASQLALFSAL